MLRDLRLLGKETLAYGLSTVVARLLNLLLLPFYTHYLAPGEYGIVTTLFAYIACLNIVFQHGMDQAYLRFASDKDSGGPEACFSAAGASLASSSLGLALLVHLFAEPLAALGLREGDGALVRYAAWVLALDALAILPFADLRLQHRKWTFVGVKTFNIALNVAMNIFLLASLGLGSRGVFLANLVASAASLVLLAPVFAQRARAAFDRALWSELVRFGLPLIPAGFAAMMVQVIDRPILLRLTDAHSVGVYQANHRLGVFMMLVVTMFDQAWRPFFLERAKDPAAPALFARVLTYFLAGAAWIALALSLFIPDLVRLPVAGTRLIHPDYWVGLPVVPIALASYLCYGAYVNFMASVTIAKRTGILVWVTGLGALVSVAANFLLIPPLGILGAAWAGLAAYAAMAAALWAAGRGIYPVPYEWDRLAKLAAAGGLCATLACAAAGRLGGDWGAWLLARLGLLALLPGLLLAAGFLRPEERRYLTGIARRSA